MANKRIEYSLSGVFGLVLLSILASLGGVKGGAILELHMIEYENPTDHEWDGSCCDLWCLSKCDDIFTFNLDNKNGDTSNPQTYTYYSGTTGTYDNSDTNIFGSNMQGLTNPIKVSFPSWPGSFLFKVYVQDDDSPWSDNDHVDSFVSLMTLIPYSGILSAPMTSLVIRGMRGSDQTSLTMEYRVYCDTNYYGSDCSTYCLGTDDATGHYTCTPGTGAIACLPGYEDTTVMCRTFSNDCIGAQCNNGVCVDGVRSYTCTCMAGYTGTHCESNINECASSPCLNGGSCANLIAAFSCACPSLYVGPTCAVRACSVNLCVNGGTCYGNNQCMCPAGFTGSMCETNVCSTITCLNSGTCFQGQCQCMQGYIGTLCDVRACDVIRCQNNASCINGACECPSGFQGISCELNTICTSRPCLNEGTCYALQNGYLCSCLSGYAGAKCENPMSPPQNVSYAKSLGQTSGTGCQSNSSVFESSTSGRVLIALLALIALLLIVLIVLICCTCRWRRRARKSEKELLTHTAGSVSFITSSTAPSTVRCENSYGGKARLDSCASANELMTGIYGCQRSMSTSSDTSQCESGYTNMARETVREVVKKENNHRDDPQYAELDDVTVSADSPPEVPAKRPISLNLLDCDGETIRSNTPC